MLRLRPRLSAPASPAFTPAHWFLLPGLRSPQTPPALLAPPPCWPPMRPLPSWLVGALLTPLKLGGAVATSDGGAHASRRNGPCGVRLSLKLSAAPPCGVATTTPHPTTTNTTPATPSCFCVHVLRLDRLADGAFVKACARPDPSPRP